MKIEFFKEVTTIEELKKEYRKLAKKFHPDLNSHDTTKTMIKINNEYEYLFKKLETTKDQKQGHKIDDTFRNIIDELIKYNELTIEIVGSWIWISGKTFELKDTLTKIGCRWSKGNKKWYYTESEKKKKRATSWEMKVNKYGCETVQKGNDTKSTNKALKM